MIFSIARNVPQISGWAGRLGLLVLLVAVFLQSYVDRTHFHYRGQVAGFELSVVKGDIPDGGSPADTDNLHCTFCHVLLQAGAYPVSLFVAKLVPQLAFTGLVETPLSLASISFLASRSWHQRAPPHS